MHQFLGRLPASQFLGSFTDLKKSMSLQRSSIHLKGHESQALEALLSGGREMVRWVRVLSVQARESEFKSLVSVCVKHWA